LKTLIYQLFGNREQGGRCSNSAADPAGAAVSAEQFTAC
jgi:hypothetical protein